MAAKVKEVTEVQATEQTTEDLKQEVATLEQENTQLAAEVAEQKKTFKEKVSDFGKKHPKLKKAGKAVGVVLVGVVSGVAGYALGRDSIDVDLAERLAEDDVTTEEF